MALEEKNSNMIIALFVAAVLVSGIVLYSASSVNANIDKLTSIVLSAKASGGTGSGVAGGSGSAGSGGTGAGAAGGGAGTGTGTGSGGTGAGPTIKLEGVWMKGDKNAKVTMVEYSDFQCPFCRSFYTDTLKQVEDNYVKTDKVAFYYKHFPLSQIHPMAQKYGEASECAGDQNKFWEYHNKIFDEQNKKGRGTVSDYTADDLKKWAGELGLDATKFNQCLDSDKYAGKVTEHLNEGIANGVRGTPTFFINGQEVGGAQPYAAFQAAIENALSRGG